MKNGITYIEKDGIYYPYLAVPEQTNYPIGKYGRMRLDFLMKHRRGTYTSLLVAFKLNAHLAEVDREAHSMVKKMTSELANMRGVDEHLKASDPLRWIQEMNNAKAQADELVLKDIIYI